ncbi:hypothetical protein MP638_005475 [Amoeboaphelidium occidentale]|nr:hypothetical protein MP638_005475 [Amoeboaphelidium occidentale]
MKFNFLKGSTKHSRFNPLKHYFQYNVVYTQLRLTKDMKSSNVVEYGPFSISSKDYMNNSESFQQLLERVGDYVKSKTTSTITELDDIILVTMPRLFQYNFNPLNIYFILNTDYILLEVNNTFGEGHLYLLDLQKEQLKVKRDFHVSPFNLHNDGEYTFTIKQEFSGKELKYFYVNILYSGVMNASLELYSTDYTPFTLSYLLTSIRILYQAFILAYLKQLRIYNKPPLNYSKESVKRIRPSKLEEYCLGLLPSFFYYYDNNEDKIRIKDHEVIVMLCLSRDYKKVLKVYHHYGYFDLLLGEDEEDLDTFINSLETSTTTTTTTTTTNSNSLLYYFDLYFVSQYLFPSTTTTTTTTAATTTTTATAAKDKKSLILPQLSTIREDEEDLDTFINSLETSTTTTTTTTTTNSNSLLYYFDLYFVSQYLFPSTTTTTTTTTTATAAAAKDKKSLILPQLSTISQLYLIWNGLLLYLFYLFFSLITPFHAKVKNAPWEKAAQF